MYHSKRRRVLLQETDKGADKVPVPQSWQLPRAATKESFSIIFQLANAGGQANVLDTLKALRERDQGIVAQVRPLPSYYCFPSPSRVARLQL